MAGLEIEDGKQARYDPYLMFWPTCIRKNGKWLCPTIWVLLGVGCILTIALVSESFVGVEYDQYGFKKNTLNNEVDLSTVYEHGQYFWGPSYDVVTFPRQYIRETLQLSIFPSNGLEFDITVVFYWKVRRNELAELYKKFTTTYRSQLESRANAKIKNRAPDFSIEQYITERAMITHELHKVLQQELDLIHIDAPEDKFFLLDVNLPKSIRERDLDTAVREQQNLEEQNKQLVVDVQKETQRQQQVIIANATITALKANSQAENIILQAYAVGNRTVTDADSAGSNKFFQELNITDASTKSLFIRYFQFAQTISL